MYLFSRLKKHVPMTPLNWHEKMGEKIALRGGKNRPPRAKKLPIGSIKKAKKSPSEGEKIALRGRKNRPRRGKKSPSEGEKIAHWQYQKGEKIAPHPP